MNKKRVCVSFVLMTLLAIGFSCSVFSPDTSSGSDIVKSVDSTVTNLKGGFAKLDSVFLTVSGARSLVVPGGDTTAYVLHSGEHVNQIETLWDKKLLRCGLQAGTPNRDMAP